MSKRETPITKCFWETCANGTLLLEYPLVRRSPTCARRLVDALILPDQPHRIAATREYPSIRGRHVIVVQTKDMRLGMYLMGQAVFSARLAYARGVASVRSILLCTREDSELIPLLKDFPEVEVWLFDHGDRSCKRVA